MFGVRWRDRLNQIPGVFKALGAIFLTMLLAAADFWDAVPLGALLQEYLGDNAATKIAFWAPVVFATLRYVSTNHVNSEPVAHDVDEGH